MRWRCSTKYWFDAEILNIVFGTRLLKFYMSVLSYLYSDYSACYMATFFYYSLCDLFICRVPLRRWWSWPSASSCTLYHLCDTRDRNLVFLLFLPKPDLRLIYSSSSNMLRDVFLCHNCPQFVLWILNFQGTLLHYMPKKCQPPLPDVKCIFPIYFAFVWNLVLSPVFWPWYPQQLHVEPNFCSLNLFIIFLVIVYHSQPYRRAVIT